MHDSRLNSNIYLENVINCIWLIASLALAVVLRNLIFSEQYYPLEIAFQASRWVLLPSMLYFLTLNPVVLEESVRLKPSKRLQIYFLHFLGHAIFLSAMAFVFQEKTFSRFVLGLFLLFSHLGFFFNRVLFQLINRNKNRKRRLALYYSDTTYLSMITKLYDLREADTEKLEIEKLHEFDSALADTIVFVVTLQDLNQYREAIQKTVEKGIRCEVHVKEFIDWNESNSTPVLFADKTLSPTYLACKRIVDLALCLPGLLVFALLYLCFGPLLRLQTKGSVIFKQNRVGLNGKPFTLYKFRTMNSSIPKRETTNEISGPAYKDTEDPRIVPLGRFFRKTSLDEFPQFLNVLIGDMSVVGPRPPLPSETSEYKNAFYKRLRVKPGLTGYWQIHSRKKTTAFSQIFEDDLYYMNNASLLFDLYLLLKTPLAMLKGEGK